MTKSRTAGASCATECLSRRKTQMPNKSCGTCHYLERVERTWMVGRCGWLERHPEIKETIPMWLPKVWPPYMFNGEGEDCPVWEATK